jgi:hypothetical protein
MFSFSIFGHKSPGSGLDPDPDSFDMLDPFPDSMNPDPQHWYGYLVGLDMNK